MTIFVREPLSAEGIYRAALRLMDAEGIDALTMRRLATQLGVATMSLYGHVDNKDDVLLGVVNLLVSEFQLPGPTMPPWDALRHLIREFRRVALAHPNLVPLTMRQPPTGSEGLRSLESALDSLRRAGLSPAQTATAYRLTASFAIGFVSLECGGFFRPVDVAAGAHVAPIDPSAVPRIAEMGAHLTEFDADAEFEHGLDSLISLLSRYAGSAGQVVEGDGGSGGDVEGVDAGGHGDPDPPVSRP